MENLFDMNMTPAQVKAISNLGLAHVGDGSMSCCAAVTL